MYAADVRCLSGFSADNEVGSGGKDWAAYRLTALKIDDGKSSIRRVTGGIQGHSQTKKSVIGSSAEAQPELSWNHSL